MATERARTIQVTHRHDRSSFMFVTQHLMKPFKKKTVEMPPDKGSHGSQELTPHRYARKHCHITSRQVEGIHVYDLVFKQNAKSQEKPRKRLFYLAGGGWQSPANGTHWYFLTRLAKGLPDTVITLVSYPLAPTTPAPRALPMLMRIYDNIIRQCASDGEEVILAGDSAGGNIVLCLPLIALSNDLDAPVPNTILAISPSTDLKRGNPEIKRVEKHDPVLFYDFICSTAKAWAGDWDLTDPRISPLFADLAPLATRGVQVHGISGGYDILGPDAVLMREKLNDAGVRGKWLEWDKQMHIFPLLRRFKFRESQQATHWIIDVLRDGD